LALTLSFRQGSSAKNVKIIEEFFEEIIRLYVNTLEKEEEKGYNGNDVAHTFQKPYQNSYFLY
jgi:hypothetical protein